MNPPKELSVKLGFRRFFDAFRGYSVFLGITLLLIILDFYV